MKELTNLLGNWQNPPSRDFNRPECSEATTQDNSIKGYYADEKGFFTNQAPKKFANSSLESCDKQPPGFIEYAKIWAKNPESVVLMGPVGRGKTQFAFAMIREMFRVCPRKIWPRYFTSPQLDSILLQAVKSQEGDKYHIVDIGSQDLLFIDDFGRETSSDRVKRQYFEIINLRYTNQLPTIISTNLSQDGIAAHLTEAIASRFQEWQIIEFGGEDLRIQRKIS